VQIFDHSHAFLRPQGDISGTLTSNDGQLCIGGHCLAQEINTLDGLDIWTKRIEMIPDYFIDELVDSIVTVGLPSSHKKVCAEFMKKRRSNNSNDRQ
jgi:hypothetical protein